LKGIIPSLSASTIRGEVHKRIDDLLDTLRFTLVLPYDDEAAWEWASVKSMKGRPIEPGNACVAAAALRHRLPLVTHNRKHFEHIPNLHVISEAP
jgi:predicted nucleic acid-binding protein